MSSREQEERRAKRIQSREQEEARRKGIYAENFRKHEGEQVADTRNTYEDGTPVGIERLGPQTFEEGVDLYLEGLRKVLLERQYQHGASSINDMGIAGLYWVMRQKLARLKAKINFQDEKILEGRDPQDDLLDIGGYGCIGWLWIKGLWGLPLENENGKS